MASRVESIHIDSYRDWWVRDARGVVRPVVDSVLEQIVNTALLERDRLAERVAKLEVTEPIATPMTLAERAAAYKRCNQARLDLERECQQLRQRVAELEASAASALSFASKAADVAEKLSVSATKLSGNTAEDAELIVELRNWRRRIVSSGDVER